MSIKPSWLTGPRGPAEPPRLPPASAGVLSVRDDLADWFEVAPLALLQCDVAGRVLRANAAMQALLGPDVPNLNMAPPALRQFLRWPQEQPAAGQTVRRDAWIRLDGHPARHLRLTVRGGTGVGSRRWLFQIEDLLTEDRLELAQREIHALMGRHGIGVATYDAAQGWVTAAAGDDGGDSMLPARAGAGAGMSGFAVTREIVEPDSLADYELLQRALRQRERAEVRYAVRHPQLGRRWLLTRVVPGELGGERPSLTVATLDVTEDEEARRRNDQLLHEMGTILDVSPAGIAYVHQQKVVRCNTSFERLLGVPAGECLQLDLQGLLGHCGVGTREARQLLGRLQAEGQADVEFVPEHAANRCYALALRRSGGGEQGLDAVVVLSDVTGPRAQQEAQAARDDLERERELMFSLPDVGIVHQVEGRIVRTNAAMAELVGIALSDLKGLPLAELYEDERAYLEHAAQDRRELAEQGRARGERRLRRRIGGGEGELIHVMVSQRLLDPDEPAQGTIAWYVNVDERHKARASQVRQEEQIRAILDSVLVGIINVGAQGIVWMNRSARRMFAGELSDFLGRPMAALAPEESDHALRHDWLGQLDEGQSAMFECRLVGRDGRAFYVVGNVVATGATPEQRVLTFALLDIARRREAETRIAQARAGLQRMIETAPLAIALFDAQNQCVLQLNQMMAEFAGRPAAEIEGRQPAYWLPGPEAAGLTADLHEARARHEPLHRELRRSPARPDGAARVWDMRIVSLVDPDGVNEQLLLVASDVTEQRAADEARLQSAIQQRDMLVKEVHHRIKNNLQGVAGLLQQNAHRHPEAAAALAEAIGQVHAIAQVHGLQVGAGGALRLEKVVEAICASVTRMFGRTIAFAAHGSGREHYALSEGDSIPVALTLNELLTNAIKHGGAGGDISCQLHLEGGQACMAVANPGLLAEGFDLAKVPAGISGLGLVRALLPRKGAQLQLTQQGGHVVADLRLQAPAVVFHEG
ncbi:PAS domain-containing sensor histidine kinase [Ideonella livida]|uniref:histidine kinase n=1 Tax=Ideonella livida TaxID=2707176 RepID=A0A7C9TIM6_9BURK|nr:PAS domain S-box protein [Ideonella livida]NDY89945.1 PAS domain S-box protein [Ideonella livida]